jgi:hypothetical protein
MRAGSPGRIAARPPSSFGVSSILSKGDRQQFGTLQVQLDDAVGVFEQSLRRAMLTALQVVLEPSQKPSVEHPAHGSGVSLPMRKSRRSKTLRGRHGKGLRAFEGGSSTTVATESRSEPEERSANRATVCVCSTSGARQKATFIVCGNSKALSKQAIVRIPEFREPVSEPAQPKPRINQEPTLERSTESASCKA